MIKKLVILFCVSFLFPKNLTLHDYDNPSASHILDADVIDDILIVSGFVGGIEFYDISNPQILNHLGNITLSSGGGGGGGGGFGGAKPSCVKAIENYAYVTSSGGVYVLNIANPSNPQNLGNISGTNNYNLENLDVRNNILAVAAHEDGVLIYNVSSLSNPQYLDTFNANNAWTVHLTDDIIYVGDESELVMYDFNTLDFIGSMNLNNSVKDITSNEGILYVALGSGGVDALTVPNFNSIYPQFIDNYNTSALANRIEIFDNKVAVSDWDDIEILELHNNSLELVGFKNTTRRTMAIATKSNYIYSAEWASVQVFEFGEIDGPDIDLSTYELNYPYVANEDSQTLSLTVTNNGNELLDIIDAYTTNNEFSYTSLNNLNPGESQLIEIAYTANSNNASGSYRIYSNDEDEGEVICETNGNINGANMGDIAPDFNLSIIANGSGTFRLSDYSGKIVVLAFFAPN